MKEMIRSARVAPMMNQQQEEMKPLRNIVRNVMNTVRTTNTQQQGEQHMNIQEGSGSTQEDVTKKEGARKRWAVLAGSVRFKSNICKVYEEVNRALLKDKKIDLKLNPDYCLLKRMSERSLPNHSPVHLKDPRKRSRLGEANGEELIDYFIELSKLKDVSTKIVDYDYVEMVIERGADINAVDTYGQCVLHEVARIWHVDVAKFLLEHGINVNQADKFGRTPLHVASAADYEEMVEFLLQNGADINNRTYGEHQSALHFSAKNDAVNSMSVLLEHGADINDVDYKGRSPLQLAAELDRSMTAKILIEKGAPAGVYDHCKMGALVVMIQKMPNVAQEALDQFHEKNRASRTQYFYLNFLIPPYENKTCFAKSPLDVAIESNNCNLLLHPVFQQLIKVKWEKIAKLGAWGYGFLNLCISVLWTARLCNMPSNPKNFYKGNMSVIGVLLDVIAILILVILVISEIRQYIRAKRHTRSYKEWRQKELERDLEYAHPQWPEERSYIEREIHELHHTYSAYVRDKWNYFDWLTYVMMTSTIISQACNIYYHTKIAHDIMRGIGSVTLIFLWVRLMNYARPFQTLGLFVVMISHVVEDTLKLLWLSLHFCIPYMAAFWINFGIDDVDGYTLQYLELLYNLFQMIVVGDYNFDKIVSHSQIMARLLCGTFIFFVGIICLNLFIALMSDTFQRVYDNARSTAVHQRAKFINEMETTISLSALRKHRKWIAENCAPLILYYDDDTVDSDTTTIKRLTQQIMENVDEVKTHLTTRSHDGGGGGGGHHSVKDEIHELRTMIHNFQTEYFKSLIQTKAELTGLGLMLKELIERKDCSRCDEKMKKEEKNILSKRLEPIVTQHSLSDNFSSSFSVSTSPGVSKSDQRLEPIVTQQHSFSDNFSTPPLSVALSVATPGVSKSDQRLEPVVTQQHSFSDNFSTPQLPVIASAVSTLGQNVQTKSVVISQHHTVLLDNNQSGEPIVPKHSFFDNLSHSSSVTTSTASNSGGNLWNKESVSSLHHHDNNNQPETVTNVYLNSSFEMFPSTDDPRNEESV